VQDFIDFKYEMESVMLRILLGMLFCLPAFGSNLDYTLDAVVKMLNSKTPMMVDSGTRLDSSYSLFGTLTYMYTLVDYRADEIDASAFRDNMRPRLQNGVCSSMTTLIGMGAKIEYLYFGNEGKKILSIKIYPEDCK